MSNRLFLCLGTLLALSLGFTRPKTAYAAESEKLTVYTTRESKADLAAIREFTEKTGIDVEIVFGKFPELAHKLETEKDAPKADLFMTVDGGLLDFVKSVKTRVGVRRIGGLSARRGTGHRPGCRRRQRERRAGHEGRCQKNPLHLPVSFSDHAFLHRATARTPAPGRFLPRCAGAPPRRRGSSSPR